MSKYNGWNSEQTWNINMRYVDVFTTMCVEQTYDDVAHMAESMEHMIYELEHEHLAEGSLAKEAVGVFLGLVDWREIAEQYHTWVMYEQENAYVTGMRCQVGVK